MCWHARNPTDSLTLVKDSIDKIRVKLKSLLFRCLVVAGGTARFAVHESVIAKTNINYCLTKTTEFLTLTTGFDLFALCAFVFGGAGSGAHGMTVARLNGFPEMTLVIDNSPEIVGFRTSSSAEQFLRGL
jgi:hypothetical protein